MNTQDFSSWIGKQEVTEDEISLTLVRRCAAMCDMDPTAFKRGDELPPHWYSLFFTPNALQERIGHDGHPRKGDFLPPVPLPRRMFVGREVEFKKPLIIGREARKVSEIASITPKEGRSGKLVFLQVKHTIYMDDEPTLIERQNVVYREAAKDPSSETRSVQKASEKVELPNAWKESRHIDPVLLFRYSALTWNGHRVHYDADYARNEEGYPACLMNGALTLNMLISAALERAEGRSLSNLTARMVSPLFLGETFTMQGTALVEDEDAARIDAVAVSPSGKMAAEITLFFGKEACANG